MERTGINSLWLHHGLLPHYDRTTCSATEQLSAVSWPLERMTLLLQYPVQKIVRTNTLSVEMALLSPDPGSCSSVGEHSPSTCQALVHSPETQQNKNKNNIIRLDTEMTCIYHLVLHTLISCPRPPHLSFSQLSPKWHLSVEHKQLQVFPILNGGEVSRNHRYEGWSSPPCNYVAPFFHGHFQ